MGWNPCGNNVFAPVHTGHADHRASNTKGIGSCPGGKAAGRGLDHPPQFSAEVKERVNLYVYSLSVTKLPVVGRNLIFPLFQIFIIVLI